MRLLGEIGLSDPDGDDEELDYCRLAETHVYQSWNARNQFAALLHAAPAATCETTETEVTNALAIPHHACRPVRTRAKTTRCAKRRAVSGSARPLCCG